MLIEGTKILALPREQVWQALNDPAFLQATVPGCRRMAEPRPDELQMELSSAVGPIKVHFNVEVKKLDVVAPESYVLQGGGSGGVAGSATGRVQVRLTEVQGGTQLDYSAQTEITGRIAQLGSRLIDSTARKFSEEFFANVARVLTGGAAKPASAPVHEPGPAARQSPAMAPAAAPVLAAGSPAWSTSSDAHGSRLALDGIAWRVAIGCAAGSFVGTMVAVLLMRGAA